MKIERHRLLFTTLTAVVAMISSAGSAFAAANINAFLGAKFLNEDDWEPLETQGEFGVLIDFKPKSWPVSMAIDTLASYDEETTTIVVPGVGSVSEEVQGSTGEFDLGVRKYWEPHPKMHPYLGGGLAFISAAVQAKTSKYTYVRDDDVGVGLWINGGVFWTLEKHFNIGVDARLSGAQVDLFDDERQAGGFHLGLLLGYHWD
jgi:hypothetical protein